MNDRFRQNFQQSQKSDLLDITVIVSLSVRLPNIATSIVGSSSERFEIIVADWKHSVYNAPYFTVICLWRVGFDRMKRDILDAKVM